MADAHQWVRDSQKDAHRLCAYMGPILCAYSRCKNSPGGGSQWRWSTVGVSEAEEVVDDRPGGDRPAVIDLSRVVPAAEGERDALLCGRRRAHGGVSETCS